MKDQQLEGLNEKGDCQLQEQQQPEEACIEGNEVYLIEKINQQTREIEEEVKRQQPLLGEKRPLGSLIGEYVKSGHKVYQKRVEELSKIYDSIRLVRGDGCCFYRAMLCGELDRALTDKVELIRFSNLCRGWRTRLLNQNFPDFTTNDFCDWFDELLMNISDGKFDQSSLISMLNEDCLCNYYVAFLRLVTSGYLRENAELYAGFIEGDRTVEQYCRDEIEPSFTECDNIGISALSNALGISIRVEYMNSTMQSVDDSLYYDFQFESVPPQLYFLYRPGHYDILYKKAGI